ncbi:hypothetical protein AGLY_009244 [Aphis glycines]|uniref:Major facilitator superfamily (MFS) profile domain-containing protein n=1 Tax=Aphis glycines TaxID=307491 RepID=A0A6G0TI56_APHGL|nr:hypothetical protein AGLY_009244 [Aphis glycines]
MMILNAMTCVRRSGLRHDLSASHRERDVLLRQVPVAGHRDRSVRFRTGHVHLLAAGRSPGEGPRLEGHRGRHIRPGDAVHAIRHAVPAADRHRGRRRQRRRRRGRQAGADQRGRDRHGFAEHHRTAGGREPAAAQQRRGCGSVDAATRSYDHLPNSDDDDEWRAAGHDPVEMSHDALLLQSDDRRSGKGSTAAATKAAADTTAASFGNDLDRQSRFTLSQPELIAASVGRHSCRLNNRQRNEVCYASQNLKPSANGGSTSGIMYQKDIFYSGSLVNINANRRRTISQSTNAGAYAAEITNGIIESDQFSDGICCSADAKSTIKQMLDFSLLKDPVFILYTISNFLTSIGFNIPYLYLVPQAGQMGIPSKQSSYLLALLGIANTLGRIILGFISDKPWINRLMVYNLCLAICGIATMLSTFCTDILSLSLYTITFGSTIGAYVGLTSVILVDLLGLDKLTNAFGILLMFQGIASLVGPPIAGWLYDVTGSYNPGFYLSGSNIAISGLMLFIIPYVQRRCERKELKKMTAIVNN